MNKATAATASEEAARRNAAHNEWPRVWVADTDESGNWTVYLRLIGQALRR